MPKLFSKLNPQEWFKKKNEESLTPQSGWKLFFDELSDRKKDLIRKQFYVVEDFLLNSGVMSSKGGLSKRIVRKFNEALGRGEIEGVVGNRAEEGSVLASA